MSEKSKTYEKNFEVLEKITESLNKDEVGIDDLIDKTKEALEAAKICMEILKKQKSEFKKLEKEFNSLIGDNKRIDGVEKDLEANDPF